MLIKRLCSLAAWVALTATVFAQSGFTYQGRLQEGGAPANGVYDLQFALFGTPAGGAELGIANRNDVAVQNGLFTTEIAGLAAQFNGQDRWLEVRVRPGASTGAYTTLGPRVAITRTPYAAYSFAPWETFNDTIAYTRGNVGVWDTTPVATFTVGAGDKFQVEGATGTVRFTDDLASIRFPATVAPNSPMIYMFDSGISNSQRYVVAHSPDFPNTGLLYRDSDDVFQFASTAAGPRVTIQPSGPSIGIGRDTTLFPLHLANQLGNKIALWGDSHANHYGFGVQGNLLQIYADIAASDIAFGYGASFNFTETMRVKGSGDVLIGASTPNGRLTSRDPSRTGVFGESGGGGFNAGVVGTSPHFSGTGMLAEVSGAGSAYAIWARNTGAGGSYAGYFSGRVHVVTTLSASGTKSFRIDHPLDPENKYLVHYSAESPEVLNIYRGGVALNAQGEAVVELPDYFEAINRSFEYILTAVGAPMPNLHIAQEIEGRVFRIAGGAPGKRVSWMVTAQRSDRFVQKHGAPVELDKPEELRGSLIDPEIYDRPAEESEAIRRDRTAEGK